MKTKTELQENHPRGCGTWYITGVKKGSLVAGVCTVCGKVVETHDMSRVSRLISQVSTPRPVVEKSKLDQLEDEED